MPQGPGPVDQPVRAGLLAYHVLLEPPRVADESNMPLVIRRYINAIQGALRAGYKCFSLYGRRLEFARFWDRVSTGILHRSFDAGNRP